jgi:hypothetical protein
MHHGPVKNDLIEMKQLKIIIQYTLESLMYY